MATKIKIFLHHNYCGKQKQQGEKIRKRKIIFIVVAVYGGVVNQHFQKQTIQVRQYIKSYNQGAVKKQP